MRHSLVIFDMDGTLADTSPGIINSYRYTAEMMGADAPSDETLMAHIGGSLQSNLADLFGIGRDSMQVAVEHFRDYYAGKGYLESVLFPGMRGLLESLHENGVPAAVATMKVDEYARRQVDVWGISHLFASVHGADILGNLSKADLIDMCLYDSGVMPGDAVMIGDTSNDMLGARQCGTDFIAVTYGFGFTEASCRREGIPFAEDTDRLRGLLGIPKV